MIPGCQPAGEPYSAGTEEQPHIHGPRTESGVRSSRRPGCDGFEKLQSAQTQCIRSRSCDLNIMQITK